MTMTSDIRMTRTGPQGGPPLLAPVIAYRVLMVTAVALLATFTLLTSALDATLPIGRFAGLAWLIAVSAALPRNRHAAAATAGRTQATA
jgi:hypothetical protein